ncbi:hypothetical protein CYY_004444 [Polysphondylium violaceum]|uniref:STAS domain-containing protein n=1 Tax=Polysphondylium violaceum TaxID=133409 RepID=A0A8J4V7R2_9MYCE|nr:hypothetical protein CYY_004444 [Polysphondylium violaceum]
MVAQPPHNSDDNKSEREDSNIEINNQQQEENNNNTINTNNTNNDNNPNDKEKSQLTQNDSFIDIDGIASPDLSSHNHPDIASVHNNNVDDHQHQHQHQQQHHQHYHHHHNSQQEHHHLHHPHNEHSIITTAKSMESIYQLDQDTIDYELIINNISKAILHVGKALDIIEHRSREEYIEWVKSNTEYCKKLVDQYHEQGKLYEAKAMIYSLWVRQIENCYSISSPETHDVMENLRKAHDTLFHEEYESEITSSQIIALKQDLATSKSGIKSFSNDTDYQGYGNSQQLTFGQKALKALKKSLTIVNVISTYKMEYIQNDLSVGLSSGSIIIPQSMAYALLAGMPPIYGLYTAFIPPLIYTLFGSSRHLAVGPLALMSILVGSAVQSLNPTSMIEYIGLANLLSLLVGINFLLMSFLQLGFLINFLSRPVLSGFTSAAAIIIILSMTPSLLGIPGTNQQFAWKYAIYIFSNIGKTNWIAVVIAVFCMAMLYIFKNYLKTFPKTTIPVPAPLFLVIFGLLLSYFADLKGKGVAVVEDIPGGLPSPSFFTNFSIDLVLSLYKDSLIIPIVGLIETISIAKVAATKAKYELNMNQELLGLGMANIIGGIFQGYPAAGAFGRSSLHLNSGAKTQFTTIISVVVVGVTLLFLTPVFYYLPKVVLSSIVIFAVIPLIDLEEVQNLWSINKVDMILLLVAFWSTLVLGVQAGVASAVLLSILLILLTISKPTTHLCGRIPGTATYSDTNLYPEAITSESEIIFRFDSPLIFVNAYYLRKQLKKVYRFEDDSVNPKIKAIILDCSSITRVDSTGIKYLKELIRELTEIKIVICFADVRSGVLDSFKISGIYRDVGADHFFMRIHEAVKASKNLTIRQLVEPKGGLKLNCFRNKTDNYQELY